MLKQIIDYISSSSAYIVNFSTSRKNVHEEALHSFGVELNLYIKLHT